ncbi:MAG: hypothetical protein MZU97_08125 [Bacillus subtilis]|nr:hypothetical protein [Bacillus subtilis]
MEDGPDRVLPWPAPPLAGSEKDYSTSQESLRVLLPGPPGKPHRGDGRDGSRVGDDRVRRVGERHGLRDRRIRRGRRDTVHGQAHGRDGALLLQRSVLRPREQAVPDGGPDPAGDELVHLLRERSGELHGSGWVAAGSRY